MRKAFIQSLCDLAAVDDRIVLMTGDLGFMALEPFRDRFPNRFFNMGVAEQNMVGVATGLAEAGLRPYVYSIATFASLRTFAFIRNGPVAHQLPVRVVGMGMGFEYGHSGHSHYALEDVSVMRTLPGLTVVIPADSAQTVAAMQATASVKGPVYYSLGKDDRISIPGLKGAFELGRVQVVRNGEDIALVTMGSVAQEVVAAADQLSRRGIEASVVIVSSFYPDPDEHLATVLARFDEVMTIEAQTLSGGLGAFVATTLACRGMRCRLRSLGVKAPSDGTSGNQQDRWIKHGLDKDSIVREVTSRLPVSSKAAWT